MLKANNIVSLRQYYAVILIVWFCILVLIARYFQIQIISFDTYKKKANTNRIRKITTNAPRGLILDRNGEILVDNNPMRLFEFFQVQKNRKVLFMRDQLER